MVFCVMLRRQPLVLCSMMATYAVERAAEFWNQQEPHYTSALADYGATFDESSILLNGCISNSMLC